jgi:hypothetical protein
MTKHAWLVALFVGTWLVAGCGDVESCREGITAGCLNSVPRTDGTCLYDLVPRSNKCVKPGSEDDKCGLCADGALCIPERNDCANFCAPTSPLPGSVRPPDPIFCEAVDNTPNNPADNPMLSFAEVCTRRCQLRCQRLAQFCPGYQCPQGSCETPETQAACVADCPPPLAGGNDLACLTRKCNDARFVRCDSSLTCPNNLASACANLTCTNECSLPGDGICDDSDVFSSRSPECEWGTDCVDCGPRTGTKPAPVGLGELCQWGKNCEGFTGRPSDSNAWCITLATTGVSRCVPDCSRDQDCADGFECFNVTFKDPANPTAEPKPINDGTYTSSACIPTVCQ